MDRIIGKPTQRQRDEIVRQRCKLNGVTLLEWPYYEKITIETVKRTPQAYQAKEDDESIDA